jgi:1-acyl-sn-glycerol-3-phosphate acyltransferase
MSSVCGPDIVCPAGLEQKGLLRRWGYGVISAWTWLEISTVLILGVGLQALIAMVTCTFDPTRKRAGRWFRSMSVLAAKLAPTWRFSVRGPYPRTLESPAVVVSNHVSLADPFLISHLPWEMKWLGKSSLMKTPFLGWAMRLAGDISLERGTSDSARKAMARCAEYLRMGMPVCIFPEGTRSRTSDLLPFKDGAFRLAIDTQTDILPLAVSGTEVALPKHSWLFGTADAAVTVGERIPTRGLTLEDLESLKEKTRAQIQTLLAQLRP